MRDIDHTGAKISPSAGGWMGLRWTAWMPLMAAHPLALAQLPLGAGVYRLRSANETERLLGVYPAIRGIRETVERLSRQAHLPVEPYDDPQAPARLLWEGRRRGLNYEVSGALIPSDTDLAGWAEYLATTDLTFD